MCCRVSLVAGQEMINPVFWSVVVCLGWEHPGLVTGGVRPQPGVVCLGWEQLGPVTGVKPQVCSNTSLLHHYQHLMCSLIRPRLIGQCYVLTEIMFSQILLD